MSPFLTEQRVREIAAEVARDEIAKANRLGRMPTMAEINRVLGSPGDTFKGSATPDPGRAYMPPHQSSDGV